jgi:phosphatidylglycerophosphatase A|nr:phosphatidylglycerophosphatase A [Candidatus Acidoferrales bacterium]
MSETSEAVPSSRKPRVSYFFATACGLGYLKPGPGTWGSVGGLLVVLAIIAPFTEKFGGIFIPLAQRKSFLASGGYNEILYMEIFAAIVISLLGVWTATRVADYSRKSDPQIVVIDEVSGMMITLVLGLSAGIYHVSEIRNPDFVGAGYFFFARALNWKYLLVGFILFRVFDIWKPFPARQAESLHGGWGIMADDWIAGIYAGLVLWGVQATGILK